MQVIAIAVGFDGLDLREPGAVFDMPENAKGSWFKPVDSSTGDPETKAEEPAKAEGGKARRASHSLV